ncbi:hypothetical protein EYC80_005971 [Monilinia laxa]|uniref:nicotinate phosphoribosyltransferase n=1 Tax=Monilinia laxa TaxID=61186 RepID=A0A5N6KFP7_MONLA|nr:hypothetical protein EYC80_005971 [Monilinia laxa]
MDFYATSQYPEGVISFLDTDLYKLTMQCAVLKYFSDVRVTYAFKNRTPEKKLSRAAFRWLQLQISKLGNIALKDEEYRFLKNTCTYLNQPYLNFLKEFRLDPRNQIEATFVADDDRGKDEDLGEVNLVVKGLWLDTILYEIPLLALTSEAYFRFMDTDWTYEGQEEKAYDKGISLLEAGCIVSEFGTRRRRDYHTQALVFRGLVKAKKAGEERNLTGKISGTSNVHLAMRFGIPPIGTVAHEWFMGVAAITDDYRSATATALSYWIGCFGQGVLGIALTDTFGTKDFLRAFSQKIPSLTTATSGAAATLTSAATLTTGGTSSTLPPLDATGDKTNENIPTFAQAFTGVRQDSGDPASFVKKMRQFYDEQGIKDKKTIVFSDSLDVDLCIKYKQIAEESGFQPTFGVEIDAPLNIVIKLSSADGRPAIKISDNIGKNMGDESTVLRVKKDLGYVEEEWQGGDETTRWGKEGEDIVKR